jgi:hypothetical protein
MHSGFLPLAEEAVRACPGDGNVMPAAAALLDQRPERAMVFLKRFSKRYIPVPAYGLLYALALELDNKRAAAWIPRSRSPTALVSQPPWTNPLAESG